jgi:hypothetical protein
MFAVALLLIAVCLCIYLYARYRHLCEEDKPYRHLPYYVQMEETGETDWNFPPKWHPPTGRTKA